MVTPEQATQYLASVGVTVPDFVLQAWVEMANGIQGCLEQHYTPATATLIQCYLIALMALGQGDRYVSSQTASSGASQSYRYQSFADRWAGLLSLLRALDKHGCASELIPPDPTKKSFGGILTVKAGCMRGGH